MPRKQHTHKYMKQQTGGSPVWRCALPDCNHYMPTHLTELIIGRTSICWECGDKFILDTFNMDMDKPKCHDCAPAINKLMEYLKEKGM